MELRLSCTNPSRCSYHDKGYKTISFHLHFKQEKLNDPDTLMPQYSPRYRLQQHEQNFYGGPNMYSGGGGGGGGPMQQPPLPPTHEMSQISVPNSAVGAIIGAGGSNIKQIIRDSSAFVTVSSFMNWIMYMEDMAMLTHCCLVTPYGIIDK